MENKKKGIKKILIPAIIIITVVILILSMVDVYNKQVTEKAKVQSVENMYVNVNDLLSNLEDIKNTVSANHITLGTVIKEDSNDYTILSDMDNLLTNIDILEADILNFSDRLLNGGSLTDEEYAQLITDYDSIVDRVEHINNDLNDIVNAINNKASSLIKDENDNYDSLISSLNNTEDDLKLSISNLQTSITSLSTTKLDDLVKYIKEQDDTLISKIDNFCEKQKKNFDDFKKNIETAYIKHKEDTIQNISDNNAAMDNSISENITALEIPEKTNDILGYINLYNNQYNNFLIKEELLMRYNKANLIANLDAYYQTHGSDIEIAVDGTFEQINNGIDNIPINEMTGTFEVQRHYHLTGANVNLGNDDVIVSNTPVGGCYVDIGVWGSNSTYTFTDTYGNTTTYTCKPAGYESFAPPESTSPDTYSKTYTDIDGNQVTYSYTQATYAWFDGEGSHGNGSIYGVGGTNGTHWAGAYPCGTHWGPITSSSPPPCPVHGDLCNGNDGLPAVCVSAWATYSGCSICDANGWTMSSDDSSGVVGKAIFDPNQGKSAQSMSHRYIYHLWKQSSPSPAHVYAPIGCTCREGEIIQVTITYDIDSTDATTFLSNN